MFQGSGERSESKVQAGILQSRQGKNRLALNSSETDKIQKPQDIDWLACTRTEWYNDPAGTGK